MIAERTLVVGVAGAVAQNGTSYSESFAAAQVKGYNAMLVTSSAGSITVTQQCSLDNTNWYDPVDGLGSAVGQVAAAMTASTKYIQPDPVLAQYVRFKVVEGNVAATTVTIKVLTLE